MKERTQNQGVRHARIRRVEGVNASGAQDVLAEEEPLEIRLEFGPVDARVKRAISITMRTSGSDFELAAGFLFTEGIVRVSAEIEEITYCGPQTNTVRVALRPDVSLELGKLSRHFYTTSSCGVCGKASIEALRTQSIYPLSPRSPEIDPGVIHALPERLRQAQGIFDSTGGLHASAIFSPSGEMLYLREDVGRHNALDKVVGRAFLDGRLPLSQSLLLVSGRASFELVQKAAMAGIPVLAAVGAPSSLAVELAESTGMTLLGFVRQNRFNVYSHPLRIRAGEVQNEVEN